MTKKLSVIFLVVLLHLPTFASYMSPQLELRLQAGKNRHISRASLLLPCYSTDSSLLYANVIGMSDSNHALEGNFGFGYRHNGAPRFVGKRNGPNQIYLPENPTTLQVKHELSH